MKLGEVVQIEWSLGKIIMDKVVELWGKMKDLWVSLGGVMCNTGGIVGKISCSYGLELCGIMGTTVWNCA